MANKLLTDEQIAHYRREGYLHVPGVYTEADIAEARRLIEADIENGGWASRRLACEHATVGCQSVCVHCFSSKGKKKLNL